jgi:2-polyprenyl-3-methyl-5-hydroxy-6-metoxy-1,4-benzoquinol methylase
MKELATLDPFDRDAELARLSDIAARYDDDEPGSCAERQANDFAAARAVLEVRGPDVLVLGAATGSWARPLLERFGRFDVADAVPELVARIEARHRGRVRGYVALFEELDPDRPYDTVIMGHVLEHVVDPVAVLRRARSWLQPSGRIVILSPNAQSLHRRIGVRLGMLPDVTSFSPADHELGHRRVYTRERLRADVETAGLRCATLGGLLLKPLANHQMDVFSDALRAAFFALGEELPELALVLLCIAVNEA